MRRSTLWVMAIASAFAVANLYYNQPLLAAIAQSFHASVQQVGLVPTLTQAGYALGLLLFVPLGDRVDARRLIVITLIAATLALLAAAASPNLEWLVLASFAIGAVSVTAQLILPFAAKLVSSDRQGNVLGTILSAVFVGILLSQPVSGWLGAQLGWRSIYLLAAMAMVILAVASARWIPQSEPSVTTPYPQLMRSLWQLVKEQPILREASAIQALLFAAFSGFWATLVFLLEQPPYEYGSQVAGAFGLTGIVGVVSALMLGKLAGRGDQRLTRLLIGGAIAAVTLSYLLLWGLQNQLWVLIVAAMLLSLGTQGALVANQTRIYRLLPAARSRLNTVFIGSAALGASFGSGLGAYSWGMAQWQGVCTVGLGMMAIALTIFCFRGNRQSFDPKDKSPTISRFD